MTIYHRTPGNMVDSQDVYHPPSRRASRYTCRCFPSLSPWSGYVLWVPERSQKSNPEPISPNQRVLQSNQEDQASAGSAAKGSPHSIGQPHLSRYCSASMANKDCHCNFTVCDPRTAAIVPAYRRHDKTLVDQYRPRRSSRAPNHKFRRCLRNRRRSFLP